MFNSILVVCVGNICRSPAGERSLQARLKNKKVSSAGIAALVDHAADDDATTAAAEHGISLAGHSARQFSLDIARDHDLILVMEAGHKREIVKMAPQLSGKIMLFDHWSGAKGIPDPYRKPIEYHREVMDTILAAADAWALRLNKDSQ